MPLSKGFLSGATGPQGRVADIKVAMEGLHTGIENKQWKLNKFKKRRLIISNIQNGSSSSKNSDLVILKSLAGERRQPLRVLIDSGAQANIITQKAAQKLNIKLTYSDAKLVSAQKELLEVVGESEVDLFLGNNKYTVTVVVTPVLMDAADVILGMGFLNTHKTQLLTTPGKSPKFCIDAQSIPIVKEKDFRGINIFSIKKYKRRRYNRVSALI